MKPFFTGFLLFPLSVFCQNLPPAPASAPCDNAVLLACDQSVQSSTAGSGQVNAFQWSTGWYNCAKLNNYSGYDKVFRVVIPAGGNTSAHFRLDMEAGKNLNMFLLSACSTGSCLAASEEDNIASGTYREVLDVNLAPGTYFLVVDGISTNNLYRGAFTVTMNCSCTCIEGNDVPFGSKLYCDNFSDYVFDGKLDDQSTRWRRWQNSSAQAVVDSMGANLCARFQQAGAVQPDMLYLLGNYAGNLLSTGRYRVSWRMFVPDTKLAYFNFQHLLPNETDGSGGNWACEVFFDGDGTGSIEVTDQGIQTTTDFTYTRGAWFDVVYIVDLDLEETFLFVDENFVYQWYTNAGAPANNANLAALNFFAVNGSDFYVDDLCVWKKPGCSGGIVYDPVCLKNGTQAFNDASARCFLFTNDEMEPCNTVCDLGGTSIYRGDTYDGVFTASDRAPTSLYNHQCVIDAYGGNIPPNLCADIYIFSRADNDNIGVSLNDNSSQNLRAFYFACRSQDFNASGPNGPDAGACLDGEYCFEELLTNGNNDNIAINDCHNFYYLVVTGTLGETYSNLNIIPQGDCPSNPDPIACGTPVNSAVSQFPLDQFSTDIGQAYQQCYNGSRTYNGGEAFFKFVLDQPAKVTVKLTATDATPGALGVFLYSFLCGESCLGYAENTSFDPAGTLTATLNEGIYYLVVDRHVPQTPPFGGSGFTLSLDCEQYSPFVDQNAFLSGDLTNCPTDTDVQHQVGIAFSPAYTASDYFNFYFRNTDGKLKGNTEASRYWHNSTQPMYFDLYADKGGDGEKCSYAVNDTFFVFIHQTEGGSRTFKQFEPTFASPAGGGVTDSLVFKQDGFSLITKLREVDAVNFGAETSFLRTGPDAKNVAFSFITNENWALEKVNGPAPWLTLSQTSGNGAEVIVMTFTQHTSAIPRSVVLKFYSTDHPDLYRQFITIEQMGPCTIPQAVNIVPSSISVCAGTPVTLTADAGALYNNLYNYKWSTGDTARVITRIPPVGVNNYTVTITNKYCFITGSDNEAVTVNALPPAPQNPVGASVCEGQNNIPPLSVASPGGNLQVFWYAAASGGTPLQPNPSNTYTPPAPVNATTTYFAETKNPSTTCVSTTRTPVTLTVHSNPTIGTVTTSCAPSLLTYTVTVSIANATTATTSPVFAGTLINGVFTVNSIPKGTSLTLTASNPHCSVSSSVTAPPCLCPPVDVPQSGGNKAYCAGQNPPSLVVDADPGETADWFSQMTGGDSLGTGQSFVPPGPGTYWVRARNLTNNCVSARIPVTLTRNELPNFNLLSNTCSADLKTYDLRFSSDAGSVTATPYLVLDLGNGAFEIKGLTAGTGINIHLENDATTCKRDTATAPWNCPCPALGKPGNPENTSICAGAQNVPPLKVSVASPGLTANWYFNGQLQQGSPTLAFVPATPGIYYAKTYNPINGCESKDSTALVFEVRPLPALAEGPKQCDPGWQNYQVTVSSSTPSLSSAPFIIPVNNGNGTYTFFGVPIGDALTVTATANGCTRSIEVLPPVCSCPYTPNAPQDPNNPAICLGDPVPTLSVKVSIPAAEIVDWYDAPSGGVKLSPTPSLQYKPVFAFATDTFYAQTRLAQFPNCVSARTPVVLTVDQPAKANAGPAIAVICADEKLSLNGSINGSAASGVWSSSPVGGSFQPNSTFIGAQTYTPPPGFSEVILILTAYPAAPSVCPAKQDSLFLTIRPVPVITVEPGVCDPDLNSYSIDFDTDGDQLSFVPDVGTLITNPGGTYTYSNIPEGQAISIRASYVLSGCDYTVQPPGLDCPCPGNLPEPDSEGDKIVCSGDDQYPVLEVKVQPGLTADWYDEPFDGVKLDSGAVTFKPAAPGNYYAEARDPVSGCTSLFRQIVTLSEVPAPNADAGSDLLLCPGATGTLSAFQAAGYQYDWNNGATTPEIEVPAQNTTYALTVTLGNCTDTDTVAVIVLPAVSAGINLTAGIRCHGDSNGALSAGAGGGTGPFTYYWSNDLTGQHLANLSAGAYTVTVVDNASCTDTETFQLEQPDPLALLDTMITPATNGQNNGAILAEITGGTNAYSYQWLLSNGSPFADQTAALLDSVFAGTYSLRVTDANGCIFSSGTFTVPGITATHAAVLDPYISVFPNPTTGRLYLRFSLPARRETDIRIYDLLGREVLVARPGMVRSEVLEFDLSGRPAGFYILKIGLESSVLVKTLSLKH